MKKLLLPIVFFCLFPFWGRGQLITLSGTVQTTHTGRLLSGAMVTIPHLEIGFITDGEGSFSTQLPAGEQWIEVNYPGFETLRKQIQLKGDTMLHLVLAKKKEPEEVIILTKTTTFSSQVKEGLERISISQRSGEGNPSPQSSNKNEPQAPDSTRKRPPNDQKPKSISPEGNPNRDQLFLPPGASFGDFTLPGTFWLNDPNSMEYPELHKDGLPGTFPGPFSSRVDIQMLEEYPDSLEFGVGLNLLDGSFAIEGPISRGKSAFQFTARKNYTDLLNRAKGKKNPPDSVINYYEFKTKSWFKLTGNDQLRVLAYYGKSSDPTAAFAYATGEFQWDHRFNPRLFLETKVIGMNIDAYPQFEPSLHLQIQTVKAQIDWAPQQGESLKAGLIEIFQQNPDSNYRNLFPRRTHEFIGFAGHNRKCGERLTLSIGIRAAMISDPLYINLGGANLPSPIIIGGPSFQYYVSTDAKIGLEIQLSNRHALRASLQDRHLTDYSRIPPFFWYSGAMGREVFVDPFASHGKQLAAGYLFQFKNELGNLSFDLWGDPVSIRLSLIDSTYQIFQYPWGIRMNGELKWKGGHFNIKYRISTMPLFIDITGNFHFGTWGGVNVRFRYLPESLFPLIIMNNWANGTGSIGSERVDRQVGIEGILNSSNLPHQKFNWNFRLGVFHTHYNKYTYWGGKVEKNLLSPSANLNFKF